MYGRPWRSSKPCLEGGEPLLVGLEMLQQSQQIIEIINHHMRAAHDRKRSYADLRQHEITFFVGDPICLKVFSTKLNVRFHKKGKLSPKFIGPFEDLRTIDDVAYELAHLPKLYDVHPVFHVSLLKRFVPGLY